MSNKKKNLSSPFATGSGGAHFEAHIQASFVTLMLTGGYAPLLPCWPIVEIKLQGKIDGYDADDLTRTESSGFARFATTLRKLAESYNREAEQVVLRHARDDGSD